MATDGGSTAECETAKDVTRVVGSDIDASERHQHSCDSGDRSPLSICKEESNGECASDSGVVTREREVRRSRYEDVYIGKCFVRAKPVDGITDQLSSTERNEGGSTSPDGAGESQVVVVAACVEIRNGEEHGEKDDTNLDLGRECAMCPCGAVGEPVEPLEYFAIHFGVS